MNRLPLPQLAIGAFLLALLAAAHRLDLPLAGLLGDALVRLVMNGVLVLSLLPMLDAGLGINFGLPVGISAGLLGMCLAVNLRLAGLPGLLGAMGFAVPAAVLFGVVQGQILQRVRGQEEIAGTFMGFAFISLMNLFWAVAPFSNPAMLWPIGGHGLRPSIGLGPTFAKSLNRLWAVQLGPLTLPLGMLIAFALLCLLLHLFLRTRLGQALRAVGENERFASLSGLSVPRTRLVAVVLSTLLAAWGICVYAQSYGFLELYSAPLMMAFPAASALFMGGSTSRSATLAQAVLGTFLFQTTYSISGPVANGLLVPQAAEIVRMILANGIILYALLHEGGRRRHA